MTVGAVLIGVGPVVRAFLIQLTSLRLVCSWLARRGRDLVSSVVVELELTHK